MVAVGASLRIGMGDNQVSFSIRQSQSDWRMEKETRSVADALIPRVSHGATLVVPFQGTQAMAAQTQFHFAPDRNQTPEPKTHTLEAKKYENSCCGQEVSHRTINRLCDPPSHCFVGQAPSASVLYLLPTESPRCTWGYSRYSSSGNTIYRTQ